VAERVGRGIALLFHDRGTRRGWMVSSTPRPHFTAGKDPVPILQEAGWAPGPVWTGGKSRAHRDSIPDRPARSQTLYGLSYPAHTKGRGIVLLFHDRGTRRGWVLSITPRPHFFLLPVLIFVGLAYLLPNVSIRLHFTVISRLWELFNADTFLNPVQNLVFSVKGKVIPLQARCGPEGG